jgi:hypothetical protein
MLDELLRLHDDVEMEVAAQEALLRSSGIPNGDEVARSRWKIMSASKKRREYVEAVVYPALKSALTGGEADMVAALYLKDVAQRHWATDHLAQWPLDRALTDFEDYLRASSEVRFRIRAHLQTEKQVMTPLLALMRMRATA